MVAMKNCITVGKLLKVIAVTLLCRSVRVSNATSSECGKASVMFVTWEH